VPMVCELAVIGIVSSDAVMLEAVVTCSVESMTQPT